MKCCALERSISNQQIYGDSYSVINWITGTSHLQNVMLRLTALRISGPDLNTFFSSCLQGTQYSG